ncbi:MAG: hypothetical protein N3B21_11480 [Clostridia bacterium]|nr:hypothetical protein [Clostridia bacterium]
MAEVKDLENKMKAVMVQLKECVDLSFELIAEKEDTKKIIYKYWENFLTHFLDYVKKREKDTGEDILKGLSLKSLFKFF